MKNKLFNELKQQQKEGVKGFICIVTLIFIISIALICIFSNQIDVVSESLINYLN